MLSEADDPDDAGFPVLLVGDDAARLGAARQAIDIVGGRVLATIGWGDDAAAALGGIVRLALVVAEAHDDSSATLAAAMATLAGGAAVLDAATIFSLDEAQLDLAAPLLGGRTTVLCDPTVADRIVAITTALELGGLRVADTVREDEAARLARLNAEVARIAETLARLTRREPPAPVQGATIAERRTTFDVGPAISDDPTTGPEVRRAIRARRNRDEIFGRALFEDPAWDMMLDLYAAYLERAQVSVSSLCITAAVAPTTALRWIGRMVDAGLFVRAPDPFDRRRVFMALSPRGVEGMRQYVGGLKLAGLTLA